jgi:hypothetical protein
MFCKPAVRKYFCIRISSKKEIFWYKKQLIYSMFFSNINKASINILSIQFFIFTKKDNPAKDQTIRIKYIFLIPKTYGGKYDEDKNTN